MRTTTEYDFNEPGRGRPRGRQSYSISSALNSITLIAVKNNVSPTMLFDAFVKAWTQNVCQCENLNVECRKVDRDAAVFLVTCDDRVVCQLPIKTEILQQPKLSKSYMPTIPTPVQRADVSIQKQICELRTNMRGITVAGEIVEVSPKALVNTTYGWDAYVSNVLLADKTGSIRLSLWNGQIDAVAVGDTVRIEKAKVAMFRGALQLRIGRNGTMNVDTSTREPIALKAD